MARDRRYLTPALAGAMRHVSDQTVRKYMRPGGPLAAAVSTIDGHAGAPLLDSEHPAFVAWLASAGRGRTPGERQPRVLRHVTALDERLAALTVDEVEELAQMVIHLTEKHQGLPQIRGWVKVRKEMAAAATAELKRDTLAAQLVDAEFVRQHIGGLIERIEQGLNSGVPKIVKQVGALARQGRPHHEQKLATQNIITDVIRTTKIATISAIKSRS